jgi:hypothetical protein
MDKIIFSMPHENEPCDTHKQNNMGYVERQEWAERKIKQGHKERQCTKCGYWFFKCDF